MPRPKKKFGSHFYTYYDGYMGKNEAEKSSREFRYQGYGAHVEHVVEDYHYPWKLWIRKLKR